METAQSSTRWDHAQWLDRSTRRIGHAVGSYQVVGSRWRARRQIRDGEPVETTRPEQGGPSRFPVPHAAGPAAASPTTFA